MIIGMLAGLRNCWHNSLIILYHRLQEGRRLSLRPLGFYGFNRID